ncbi:Crp/Fnr family transcriptional regulator [Chromobacterium haemolyticum]|uniref:Crp/Fnr family transcriptional regulator n=1 Tax=Chromobacterium haemolyticum TaxID=394935 RepID=UPI0005BBF78C|nr:Crp/Fnr family transcriptional regulator [Chromobacterium haemolyticum]
MPAIQNHLIELLPRTDQLHLLEHCKLVELTLSEILCAAGDKTRYVYFPTGCFISQVAQVEGQLRLEVGMVGTEGMLGSQLALGQVTEPLHALVQGSGAVLRMSASAFSQELLRSKALQRMLNRYLYVQMLQLATSSSCMRFHQIDQRLARWLLMSQDRVHSDSFHVTHEFLSIMLGVRRVGVTMAAGLLQRSGLIEYHRGTLTVRDRSGLEASACSCYARNCHTYQSIMH